LLKTNHMKNITRHSISFLIFFTAISCSQVKDERLAYSPGDGTEKYFEASLKPFYHGVASGDPLPDRIIIWTRITPDYAGPAEVNWEMAKDADFREIVNKGRLTTDSTDYYTVKVDVDGLMPGTFYYYRFRTGGDTSLVGRTKTAPDKAAGELRFAVVSCANYEGGYFNAYGKIAERNDLDAVIHLGDYIYEYERHRYHTEGVDRRHLPAGEIISLSEYRTRYAQYRLDPNLRKAHQQHPFIAVYDDHEIANDTYVSGAQNHQPEEEGPFKQRKRNALTAYHEWMPIRERKDNRIYRQFSFGNIASLIMLDERLEGRSEQLDSSSHADFKSSERSMLGQEQLTWFKGQLKSSDAIWKIIGNQVIFSPLDPGPAYSDKNMDSWDGYPAEREDIMEFIKENEVENVVFITGDTHSSWAFEVTRDPENAEGAIAVEFGTTSISSGNFDEYEGNQADSARILEEKILDRELNRHLHYVNITEHGYLLLTLNPRSAKAEWYYVGTIREPSAEARLAKTFTVERGSNKLTIQ